VRISNGTAPLQTEEFTTWMQCLISRTIYLPAYRNLINQGGGTYYEIAVGQDFIKLWDSWKNGDNVTQRRTILEVLADIKAVFGFKDLNAEATPQKDTLQITVDGRSERIRELGAGLSQFIIVLGNVAMKKPEVLFLDEPELNLHPALQDKFLTALAKYARHIVYASHSLGLARAAGHVYSVRREGGTSVIKPLPGTRSYAELVGEMGFASYQELGFEQILCVEGIHDVLAIQQFLRLLGLDRTFVVIPLGGSAFINPQTGPQLNELKRITLRVAALIDSERSSAAEALSAARQGFLNECQSLQIKAHATDRRAFEHYLTDAAVKKAKGPGFRALTPYEDFNTFAGAWAKDENWRIAQHMTAAELLETDLGVWLSGLRDTAVS
jgi:energy-coupling factor transporter ATP-binding protein EcfA2